MMKLLVEPGGSFNGEIIVPGDKSISHRAAILGAISDGTTTISNFLCAQDCLDTLAVLQQLGVAITQQSDHRVIVQGVGLQGLSAPDQPLYFGNSGTGIRLLSGLLAVQGFGCQLQGDASLHTRPMQRIIEPLSKMGAQIKGVARKNDAVPPLMIEPCQSLHGMTYQLPVPSAQIKSCLLLAGLYAKGETTVIEPTLSRDHSERLMSFMGADIKHNAQRISIKPSRLQARHITIPNDISSAAFFLAGAAMVPGSSVVLKDVGLNPRRLGVVSILRALGAKIHIEQTQSHPEPIGDITVTGGVLKGISVPKEWVVDAIDEFPVLFVVASCAKGQTKFEGLAELRFKESDRLLAMATGLTKLGIDCELTADGLCISGGQIKGGTVDSFGDHRVAMAFVIAGLAATHPIVINNCEAIATSFPEFGELTNKLGLHVIELDDVDVEVGV